MQRLLVLSVIAVSARACRTGVFLLLVLALSTPPAALFTAPAIAQVCTPIPPAITCPAGSQTANSSLQRLVMGATSGQQIQASTFAGTWRSSFGDTWTLASDSTGTVNFNGRLFGECPNIWPVTVAAAGNQFTATATEPGPGNCDTTFGDILTINPSGTSASGTYFSNPSGRTGPDTWILTSDPIRCHVCGDRSDHISS
jgi:hypothetical protein